MYFTNAREYYINVLTMRRRNRIDDAVFWSRRHPVGAVLIGLAGSIILFGGSPEPGEGNIQARIPVTSVKTADGKKTDFRSPFPTNVTNIVKKVISGEQPASAEDLKKAQANLVKVDAKKTGILCPPADRDEFRAKFSYSAAADDEYKAWCIDAKRSVVKTGKDGTATFIVGLAVDPRFSAADKISPYSTFKKVYEPRQSPIGDEQIERVEEFARYAIMRTGDGIIPAATPARVAVVADIRSVKNESYRTIYDTWETA